MRIIQGRELVRVAEMVKSKDPEIRELGASILTKGPLIRLNFTTLALIHGISIIGIAALDSFIISRFLIQPLVLMPMLSVSMIMILALLFNLRSIYFFRRQYMRHADSD